MFMDNGKRKNNVKGNKRERANKGGRPVKRSHGETEIPCHGEDGNRGLLSVEIQSKVSRCFCQRVHSGLHHRGRCKGTALERAWRPYPQTLRYGEQLEPTGTESECGRVRLRVYSLPHTDD